MMSSLILGTLTFLVVAPAISICNEDSSKTSLNPRQSETEEENVTQHPQFTNHLQDIYDSDKNEQLADDPWSFYRQLRAPSGFLGVRGKKDYDPASYWEQIAENEALYSPPKRAPSQSFFGMRGKKLFSGDKRAPSGFVGMRGKKDNYFDEASDDDLQAELYRDLMMERARIANIIDELMEEKEKRKPSGFVGLRGKKSVNNDDYFEYEKRAPMGFQGVRGKKSEYPNFSATEDKRVPVAGFFGMRGKKQPFVGYQSSQNFFGVRKKPYMPYGKFVGVRGKKSQDGAMKMFRLEDAELSQGNGLRSARRVPSETTQDKSIGFIGMRG